MIRHLCGGLCVLAFTFKLEFLWNQLADHDKMLSEATLGWGRAALGFGADRFSTVVSMATDSSHMVILGENGIAVVSLLLFHHGK